MERPTKNLNPHYASQEVIDELRRLGYTVEKSTGPKRFGSTREAFVNGKHAIMANVNGNRLRSIERDAK